MKTNNKNLNIYVRYTYSIKVEMLRYQFCVPQAPLLGPSFDNFNKCLLFLYSDLQIPSYSIVEKY